MKILKMWSFAVFVLNVTCSPVMSDNLLEIDFSEAQGYSEGQLIGQNGWELNYYESQDGSNSDGVFNVKNESAVLTQSGWGGGSIVLGFPLQSEGLLTLTWDTQALEGPVDFGFAVYDSENFDLVGDLSITWEELSVSTRLSEGKEVLDAYNGNLFGKGSYDALTPFDYTDGKIIHIRAIIDVAANTYDLFATKEGETEVKMAHPEIGRIAFFLRKFHHFL